MFFTASEAQYILDLLDIDLKRYQSTKLREQHIKDFGKDGLADLISFNQEMYDKVEHKYKDVI